MNGDYTKVPLRAADRWTGARMQQGRVLLDHEWNLNLDADDRRAQWQAIDTLGRYGVVRGTDSFKVGVSTSGPAALTFEPGHIWVGGMLALTADRLSYADQRDVPPLPAGGSVMVFIEVFPEHVQPAEDPQLVEPALAPIEASARTRVGYRLRYAVTSQTSPREAWLETAALLRAGSTGLLSIAPVKPSVATDPCAPLGNPQAVLPDGLLRVEVLDGGDATHARFAWSYENASVSAPVTAVTGSGVTVSPWPGADFQAKDLVELSWATRRADRVAHGDLYEVQSTTPVANGTTLTLKRGGAGVTAPPAGVEGLVVRRWNGAFTADGTAHDAVLRSQAYARLTPQPGTYEVGDWWGSRVRSDADGVEPRVDALPDGSFHSFAPLALVDLTHRLVEDARPKFVPLLDTGNGTSSITVYPGDDLDDAVRSLSPGGGELCLQRGEYDLKETLSIDGLDRLTLRGAGPATVLRAIGVDAAVLFRECDEIRVRDLRIEGGTPSVPSAGRDGALMFEGCRDVVVSGCTIGCRDGDPRTRTCVTARAIMSGGQVKLRSNAVRIERCRFEAGARQVAVLITDADDSCVRDNQIVVTPSGSQAEDRFVDQGIVVGGVIATRVQVLDNVIEGVAEGIRVALSTSGANPFRAGDVQIRGNFVSVTIPRDYKLSRGAIFVGDVNCLHIANTAAEISLLGTKGTRPHVVAIRVESPKGPFLDIRDSCLDGFQIGVAVKDPPNVPGSRVWVVQQTMAANSTFAVDASKSVVQRENIPEPPPPPKLKSLIGVPTLAASAQKVTATVEIDSPAGAGGAAVSVSSSDPTNTAGVAPSTVMIPAGQTTGTFEITVAAIAAGSERTANITASYGGASQTVQLKARGATAVTGMTLDASEVTGAGAVVFARFTINPPAEAGTVATPTSNSPFAGVPVIPLYVSGSQGSFPVFTSAPTTDQQATIGVTLGGVTVTKVLLVRPWPLLKVARVRLLKLPVGQESNPSPHPSTVMFDSNNPGSLFASKQSVTLEASDRPTAVEVTFSNANVNPATVTAQQSFRVIHGSPNIPQPTTPTVVSLPGNTVRWCSKALPIEMDEGLVITDYTVRLAGEGGSPIRSDRGRRLDGNFSALPSGDGVEGGDFAFVLKIKYHGKPDVDNGPGHYPDPNIPGNKYSPV
jgi:hypothetical protein